MKRKRTLKDLVGPAFFLLLTGLLFPVTPPDVDKPIKYFRVDKVITVTGTVTEIKNEKSYYNSNSDFVVAFIKEKKTGELYKIEFSPAWYFNLDIMEGSKVRVTGSDNLLGGQHLIMTQSLVFEGDIVHFRDKSGFPLWRGKGRDQGNNDGRFQRKRKGTGGSGGDGKGRH